MSCQNQFAVLPALQHMVPGVLLIHGFTATPECLEPLAAPLRKAGYQVEAPLLAGHGLTPQDLNKTTWQDWYATVQMSYAKLSQKTDSVCVAGLSLGGLLALLLASEKPVKCLAVLATPLFLSGFLARVVLPLLINTPFRYFYPYQKKWKGPSVNDPWGKENFKGYDVMPLKSVWEIVKLQKVVRGRLGSIKVPTLIVHSPHDITAPYSSMGYLSRKLGSKMIRPVTLKRSNHILTMDYERELVAEEVVQFFGGLS